MFPLRVGDEWYVGGKGGQAWLKASVGDEPNQPPTTGWKFDNRNFMAVWGDYVDDSALTCKIAIN